MAPRHLKFALGAVLVGGIGGALLAEAVLWLWDPPLRVQRVQAGGHVRMHGHGADVYWVNEAPHAARIRAGCPDGAAGPRVLLVGSSILYGSGLTPQESSGPLLRAALAERGLPDACVINASEPGANFATELAYIRAEHTAPAALLVWELWGTSRFTYVRSGGSAYNMGDLETGPDGLPDPWRLGGLNRLLMRVSGWYARAAIAAAPAPPPAAGLDLWTPFAAQAVPAMLEEARARGSRLLVVSFPALDRPFAAQRDQIEISYRPVLDAVEAAGAATLELDRALEGHRLEDIRRDTCCHYNPHGLGVVNGLIADAGAPLLGARAGGAAAGDARAVPVGDPGEGTGRPASRGMGVSD